MTLIPSEDVVAVLLKALSDTQINEIIQFIDQITYEDVK